MAAILIDQSDDITVGFSESMNNQIVTIEFEHRSAPVARLEFMSDRDAGIRFAMWLEDVAALIRSEMALMELDAQAEAQGEAHADLIQNGPF